MTTEFVFKQCLGFLKTPSLWYNEQFGIQQFDFPEIDLARFQSRAIPSKVRLGHQMEYVFKQLIEHSTTHEVLLHNLPIRREKHTLGEIDFILKEVATKKLIHVELTYKFYIINPDISEPIHRLMGPNKGDMFFTKMEKVKNEQFELLHSTEGASILKDNNINHEIISHQACYKAQLFRPYRSETAHIRPLNTSCICGYWVRFSDFNTLAFKSHQFYIPSKSEWVVEPHDAIPWTTHFEILMDINLRMLKENAPMVWMKKSDMEFEKFFVIWW